MASLLPLRCFPTGPLLNENQSNVSFSKCCGTSFREPSVMPHLKEVYVAGMAMNNFIASMKTFSNGLLIFATDLRASRHSDWYCIRIASLVIIRRGEILLTSLIINKSRNTFLVYFPAFYRTPKHSISAA